MNADQVSDIVGRLCPEFEIIGSVEALTGGLMNEVWAAPARPHHLIVKHAPPYIASAPEIPLDPGRILIEAICLELFGPGGRLHALTSEAARPPRLVARNDESHVIVIEDAGRLPDLSAWLTSAGTVPETGSELGRFIGALHNATFDDPALATLVNNLPIQRTRNAVQYRAIGELCARIGLERVEIAGRAAASLGERLLLPGRCVIMGDLWAPSILVDRGKFRVIDWEFAHYGNPAQDVAHLAAHLWMLAHRKPIYREKIDAFWELFKRSYDTATARNRNRLWSESVLRDAAVHFGSEILVRAAGAFKDGYLYDGLALTSPVVREAIRTAEIYITQPARWASFSIAGSPRQTDYD